MNYFHRAQKLMSRRSEQLDLERKFDNDKGLSKARLNCGTEFVMWYFVSHRVMNRDMAVKVTGSSWTGKLEASELYLDEQEEFIHTLNEASLGRCNVETLKRWSNYSREK